MKHHHLTLAGFLLPALAAGLVWGFVLHEHGHWVSLGICLAAFVLIWPLVALVLLSSPTIVLALVTTNKQRTRYRKRRKDKGKERSAPIRAWMRRVALRADRHRCVYCHTKVFKGPIDHSRPYALGGLTWVFNLFVLCTICNLTKCDYWVDPEDGYVHYHGHERYADYDGRYGSIPRAAAILAAERRRAKNPLRWLRAAWSLAW